LQELILTMKDIELYEIFFSKRKDYYIEKLHLNVEGKRFTFNYAPLIFGIFWFLYRKMYLESLIIFLILFAESNFENMVLIKLIGAEETKLFSIFFTIISSIIAGFIGNLLYINFAKKNIIKSKNNYVDFEERKDYLLKKGGTSFIPVILVIFLLIGVTLLTDEI